MRRWVVTGVAALAGCTGQSVRVGSEIPMGATLTTGRYIESTVCKDYPEAYAALVHAAHGDLVTDVEVSDGLGCAVMRGRAVRIVPPGAATVPAPLVAGQRVRLKEGVSLLNRPVPGSASVDLGLAATGLTLKSRVPKPEGSWWYVTFQGGAGWALETDLTPAP